MKIWIIILLIGLCGILHFKKPPLTIDRKITFRDTVFVPKEIIKPSKPIETIVYKTDTILRDRVQDTTIVVETNINRRKLEVTTIDTKSLVTTDVYTIPKFAYTLTIDNTGNVKIKRKILPRILIGVGTALVVYSSIKILNNLKNEKRN
jgi:hypothetical protein